jgi:hypothetical protein
MPHASGTAGCISNAADSPTVEQLTGRRVAQSSHSVDLSWDRGDGNDVAGAAIALIIIFEARRLFRLASD